jgi:signal transduction histidine kinase
MADMLVQLGEDSAEEVAHRLIELACDILSCKRAALSIIEPETGLIVPFAVAGLSPKQERRWWRQQRSQSLPLSQMADQEFVAAMQAGTPRVYDFTRPPHKVLPNPYDSLTMMIVPLLLDSQLIGFLALDHGDEYHQYSPTEQKLAGAVAQLAGLVIDRERLMREHLSSQAQALALEETMSNMQSVLGMTSHELRTPLTSIKANVQLAARAAVRAVESGDLPEPVRSQMIRAVTLLDSVNRQTDQMNRFVTDLLDTTRIQAGKLELHVAMQDIVALAREVVRVHQVSWPQRKLALQAPASPLFLACDPDRISQVLTNLITNALKYSPESQPIRVQVQVERAHRVRLAVVDQGPGITVEQQEHLFDAFVQAEGIKEHGGAVTGSAAGLGLGLFICQAIVTQHGGEIGVTSAFGSGSTFWFTLPLLPN